MIRRYGISVLIAAIAVCMPHPLRGGEAVFYQCTDERGAVFFGSEPARGDARCLALGMREERRALDEKVRRLFAGPASAAPALEGNVVRNGRDALRSFHAKMALAEAGDNAPTVYFVGDSHLLSGDFIRGFLDELDQNHQVGECLLCMHPSRKVRVRKSGPAGRAHYVFQTPKDFPQGVPRTCISLIEQANANNPVRSNRQPLQLASLFAMGNLWRHSDQRPRIRVFAYSIGGKTFQYFAASDLLGKDLSKYQPDLVVAMLGTNDAFARPDQETVRRDITDFIASVRRASPASELLFIGPPDSFFRDGRDNEYIDVVRKELRSVADTQGFGFWDLYTLMGGKGSMASWQEKGLSQKDKVHFLADGYMILGRLFYQAVEQ